MGSIHVLVKPVVLLINSGLSLVGNPHRPTTIMERKPVVLIIRDGWGANHNDDHDAFNAVKLAKTPVADRIASEYPRTEIFACGRDVGLPDGIMGNSEVGHQNIGAGRIVDQEIVRIDKGFELRTIFNNSVFLKAIEKVKSGGKLHLMGITSDAGVHGMLEHLYGLVSASKELGVSDVLLHAFADGRDTPPESGLGFIKQIESRFAEIGLGKVATITGRYYAMDRDLRWDRVQKAYDCITGKAPQATASSATAAIESYYANPSEPTMKGDEFIPATQILDAHGMPVGVVADGDAVIFYNFRGDRPRELTRAFIEKDFQGFDRGPLPEIFFATMTEYQKGLCPNILFTKPPKMASILGEVLSNAGIPQFRCAETEKFPHVTFFFNDYREEPFPLEDRAIIPSDKTVSTYDQKPEMSAFGVCAAAKEAILSKKYGLLVVNFANPDMVGHTGSLPAVIKACEIVDGCVGELLEATRNVGGSALITADHGNSDQMYDPSSHGPHTSHTLNPVEVVIVDDRFKNHTLLPTGRLADIAPTLLCMMGIDQPEAMTGSNLITGV
jgi:2,3-bisphosphoglycerate-independent phosphoglycerate mutase